MIYLWVIFFLTYLHESSFVFTLSINLQELLQASYKIELFVHETKTSNFEEWFRMLISEFQKHIKRLKEVLGNIKYVNLIESDVGEIQALLERIWVFFLLYFYSFSFFFFFSLQIDINFGFQIDIKGVFCNVVAVHHTGQCTSIY